MSRPRIHGTVRNAAGDPIPGIGVSITALLDPESPDLPDHDSMHGFASFEYYQPPAEHAMVVAKLTVQTDRLGEYSVIFPRGNQYGASAANDSGSVFEKASVENPEAFKELVLDLKIVPGPPPFPVRFQFENGDPIAHAEASIAIGGNLPWGRGFPSLKTNSNGLITIPWLELGTDYGLWLQSDQLTRIFYKDLKAGPTVITVPMKYVRTQ
ncbi:MAG: hypothetical protein ACE5H3_02450 [Planctomycetota bacterium]